MAEAGEHGPGAARAPGRERLVFGWVPPAEVPAPAAPAALSLDAAGAGGLRFFLRASETEVARQGEDLVLRVGALRRRGGAPLSASQLAGLVREETVDAGALTGDGVALRLRPRAAALSTFAPLLSLRQLHLTLRGDGLVGASHLADLLPFLSERRWDEEARAQMMVLRVVLAGRTALAGVRRLVPGVHLRWAQGALIERRLRGLADLAPGHPPFRQIDAAGVAALDQRMGAAVAASLAAAAPGGAGARVLLSGGMDSTLLQAWLRDQQDPAIPARTLAFSLPAAASFQPETDAAALASRLLGTQHRAIALDPARYAAQLLSLIDRVSAPAIFTDGWPGVFTACEAAAAEGATLVLLGTGADALHGVGELRTVALAETLAPFPRLRRAIQTARPLLLKAGARGERLFDAAALGDAQDPLRGPSSFVGLCADLDHVLACLGEAAVQRVFDERRAQVAALSGEDHRWSRLQMADLLSVGVEGSAPLVEAGAAAGVAVAHPYLDEEAVAAVLAFDPEVRFLARRGRFRAQLKPLQVALLERRGLGPVARQPKRGTCLYQDSFAWMATGVLRPLVEQMAPPAMVPAAIFAQLKARPDHLLWNLLMMDLFERRVLRGEGGAHGR